jgi:hypothetical protein
LNLFTGSSFQREKTWILPLSVPKALLPLKKGGREGFLRRLFPNAKGLPFSRPAFQFENEADRKRGLKRLAQDAEKNHVDEKPDSEPDEDEEQQRGDGMGSDPQPSRIFMVFFVRLRPLLPGKKVAPEAQINNEERGRPEKDGQDQVLEVQYVEEAHFPYPPVGWLLKARKRVKARIKQPRPRIPKRR